LEEITKIVIDQQARSVNILKDIQAELEGQKIFIIKETQLNDNQRDFVKDYFLQKVSPQLMTIILNDLRKFPTLKDTAAYLAVKMIIIGDQIAEEKQKRYALIEIPKGIDRFVVLPKEGDKNYIIILDDLIRYCLRNIFTMFEYESISAHMIKITRDAELDMDNDLSKSFIAKISSSVEHRKVGNPVRFVYDKSIAKDTLSFLKEKMNIEDTDSIIPGGRYHNRRDYMGFPSLGRHDLMYDNIQALPVKGFSREGSLFEQISQKDYLQYAPYHTFSYVIKFLREAALDPKVRSIKITVYRLASNSQVLMPLKMANKLPFKLNYKLVLMNRPILNMLNNFKQKALN